MKKLTLTITLIMGVSCLTSSVIAQTKQAATVNVAKALSGPKVENIIGLLGLDASKFEMSHSYSLSYTSGGGDSYNQGLYLNTMSYKFANPLTVHLQLGLLHQPFGDNAQMNTAGGKAFISSAGMEFRPSDTFKVQLEYSRRPTSLYYNPAFRDPISRNRAWFDHKTETKSEE